jgi:hypothetical protein
VLRPPGDALATIAGVVLSTSGGIGVRGRTGGVIHTVVGTWAYFSKVIKHIKIDWILVLRRFGEWP